MLSVFKLNAINVSASVVILTAVLLNVMERTKGPNYGFQVSIYKDS
jgi:hypothetical protein